MIARHGIGTLLLTLAASLFLSGGARAEPLVTAAWVKERVGRPEVKFLDIREESLYRVRHIPKAINYPYVSDNWRVRPLAGTNPRRTEELFNARMSELGITNDSYIVLVHGGRSALDVASAAFVYWHFKLLGHDGVAIMNGGMPAYVLENGPIESVTPNRDATDYRALFRPQALARQADINATLSARGLFIDFRASGNYLGVNKLAEVARYGTLPGALNVPADWLTVDAGGTLKPQAQLRKLFDQRQIPIGLPFIAFSSASEPAALGWFVASEVLGNRQAKLYEAGMREWAANPDNPVQRIINLD